MTVACAMPEGRKLTDAFGLILVSRSWLIVVDFDDSGASDMVDLAVTVSLDRENASARGMCLSYTGGTKILSTPHAPTPRDL